MIGGPRRVGSFSSETVPKTDDPPPEGFEAQLAAPGTSDSIASLAKVANVSVSEARLSHPAPVSDSDSAKAPYDGLEGEDKSDSSEAPSPELGIVWATAVLGCSAGAAEGVDVESSRAVDVESSRVIDVESSRAVDVESSRVIDVESSRAVDVESSRVIGVDGIHGSSIAVVSAVDSQGATHSGAVAGSRAAVGHSANSAASAPNSTVRQAGVAIVEKSAEQSENEFAASAISTSSVSPGDSVRPGVTAASRGDCSPTGTSSWVVAASTVDQQVSELKVSRQGAADARVRAASDLSRSSTARAATKAAAAAVMSLASVASSNLRVASVGGRVATTTSYNYAGETFIGSPPSAYRTAPRCTPASQVAMLATGYTYANELDRVLMPVATAPRSPILAGSTATRALHHSNHSAVGSWHHAVTTAGPQVTEAGRVRPVVRSVSPLTGTGIAGSNSTGTKRAGSPFSTSGTPTAPHIASGGSPHIRAVSPAPMPSGTGMHTGIVALSNVAAGAAHSSQASRLPNTSALDFPRSPPSLLTTPARTAEGSGLGLRRALAAAGAPILNAQTASQAAAGSWRHSLSTAVRGTCRGSESRILGERTVQHEVRVPKLVVVEDVVERTIVVPEKRIREELTEETTKVVEKIVEIAKPVIQEVVVEVPEIEYVEKIVEIPEVVVQEKIREVARVEYQERIIEVPRVYTQEKIVEVPNIEYREYNVEKIVEVPEVREQVLLKEIPVPQYVDKPIPEYVTVEDFEDVDRRSPLPIEVTCTYEFVLPRIRQVWRRVELPLYVPKFVEIAVPSESMSASAILEAEEYSAQLMQISSQPAINIADLEGLARAAKASGFGCNVTARADISERFTTAWRSGSSNVLPAENAAATATVRGACVLQIRSSS